MEALAILLALLALAILPCLVVFVLFADAVLGTVHRHRLSIRRIGAPAARRGRGPDAGSGPAEVPVPAGPPLEQIAAEIHRLTYARRTCTPGSARFLAATRAYDRRLISACRALEIEHSLADLDGVDLELERVRVEGELLAAGFVLDTDFSRPA